MRKLGILALGLLVAGSTWAGSRMDQEFVSVNLGMDQVMIPKSASANTVASRGFVSASQTLYGGFSLAAASTVYILVRGNSMSTLNVTQNYLDAPRVRLFDQANRDILVDGLGNPGSNGCDNTASNKAPVYNYYQSRGAVQSRDFCIVAALSAGVYTFTVTPSIPGSTTVATASAPSSGEVLFEVTLGP